jgi:prephenate dehydrogenase
MTVLFDRVAIVGVGLIGGSLAAAIKRHGLARSVVGIGRHADTIDQAKSLGLIDVAATDLVACRDADLVVLCVPVAQMQVLLQALLPHLRADALVTDAGSTKQDVVAAARVALRTRIAQFVPGHPIAGKEINGPEAAESTLYSGKRVVLTPLEENPAADVERVQALWQAVGARVSLMTPAQHDAVFGAVSHLPHLLAYALVAQIAGAADSETKLSYAGGGFRDFTRIAASSAEMWRDIFLANKDAVLAELAAYENVLAQARAMLQSQDGEAVERWLAASAVVRQNWKQQ